MNTDQPIETQAVVVREQSQAVERVSLSIDELHEQLAFIRQVMAREMKEGQDYGKIPGCGDKPGLFQPGAQKLLLTFQLTPKVKKEVLRDLPHPIFGHREYEFTVSVVSKTGREWDGVGTCSTFESKYRYRKSSRKCPNCGKESIFRSKNPGEGWYCWAKKGGCGAKFAEKAAEITSQEEGKAENENPAESWNTVRKMAFKRAIVHAAINATNTSELWSQDLEDLPQAHSAKSEYIPDDRISSISSAQAMEAHDDNPCFDEAPPSPKTTQAPKTPPAPHVEPPKGAPSTKIGPKYRLQVLNRLKAAPGGENRNLFHDFAVSKGWIKVGQEPEDWPFSAIPATPEAFFALGEEIQAFERTMREGVAP